MGRKTIVLLPKSRRIISDLGENIKLARLRRKLSAEQVAERANISRPTLIEIEKGSANTSMGAYLQVLAVLGLEQDLSNVAKDDKLGRKLQDISISTKKK
nr:helix-turn-helix transcriptional regulator [uncultured Marinifilum sp.]